MRRMVAWWAMLRRLVHQQCIAISADATAGHCTRDDLSAALRSCGSVLDLLGRQLSSLRCSAYRLRGTQQTSSAKTNKLRDHPIANTPRTLTDTGLRCRRPARPLGMPYSASLSLETATHL